ncbi:hypothetical protein HMN09_01401900 [Mycena chlorophos]|uniref:Uncharacterized protein n=1 Tax=Mycena chlorophos TaxID=658473 RepID=A0A8H6RZ47_MYCCL|nr:hypothetical protein HMN09_01401900 [Mycena chlorophos]
MAAAQTPPLLPSPTMSLIILFCAVAHHLILEVAAQTLYGVLPASVEWNEVISVNPTFFPVATGTDGVTTWVAEDIVTYMVLTFASSTSTFPSAGPSDPTTFSYFFVPTPGGLEGTVGTPTVVIVTGTAPSLAPTWTLTLAPERLSCKFNGSSLAVCEEYWQELTPLSVSWRPSNHSLAPPSKTNPASDPRPTRPALHRHYLHIPPMEDDQR